MSSASMSGSFSSLPRNMGGDTPPPAHGIDGVQR